MNLQDFINPPVFEEFGAPPCSETDPEAFFPVEYEWEGKLVSVAYQTIESAKAICNTCPYIKQCLQYAIENHEIGIWGGTTEKDRSTIRRRRRIKIEAAKTR